MTHPTSHRPGGASPKPRHNFAKLCANLNRRHTTPSPTAPKPKPPSNQPTNRPHPQSTSKPHAGRTAPRRINAIETPIPDTLPDPKPGRSAVTRHPQSPLTAQIIGMAMRVHTALGPGLLESAYERCLCHEFDRNEISYARQVSLPITYEGLTLASAYRADLIVAREVIVEVKAIDRILPIHQAQLLTYLRISQYRTGLLFNFNTTSLRDGIRRCVL